MSTLLPLLVYYVVQLIVMQSFLGIMRLLEMPEHNASKGAKSLSMSSASVISSH